MYLCDIRVSQAIKDASTSYDALVDLFDSIERFLIRLAFYTTITLNAAMRDTIVKIMVEILSTLALATKQVKQGKLSGYFSRWSDSLAQSNTVTGKIVKKIFGENEIEAVLRRLDRLTQDEARATGTQTLEVVCGLVQHRRDVMDGEKFTSTMFVPHQQAFGSPDIDDKTSADNVRETLGQIS